MSETLPFDVFKRVQLRVGEVQEVSDHPNADKLYVLTVDFGDEKRQMVAGLKGYYDPGDIVGKKIVAVTNLQPASLRGVESQGMLLAAQSGQVVSLLTVDKDVPAGSKVL
jgi:methionyl-tRNA synthetase